MNGEDWMNQYPEQTTVILDTLATRFFMRSWKDLHPIANEFQRKIILEAATDILDTVLGVNDANNK